jgi:RHS repeat-associated protein
MIKYGNKEEETMLGLNLFDFDARWLDETAPSFTTPDPLAEKYYSISPYAYCLNNPIRNIDLRGDSVTVLNLGYGTEQHMGILIQNNAGKWQYYSVNGDNVYSSSTSGSHTGGREFDDIAIGNFDNPQQFMNSQYNSKGDKNDKDGSNKYGYTEGYVIPTTPEQDQTIAETFKDISANEEYGIISNNCATAVQKSLKAAGIKVTETRKINRGAHSTFEVRPYVPSQAFETIMKNNPNGMYIIKTK